MRLRLVPFSAINSDIIYPCCTYRRGFFFVASGVHWLLRCVEFVGQERRNAKRKDFYFRSLSSGSFYCQRLDEIRPTVTTPYIFVLSDSSLWKTFFLNETLSILCGFSKLRFTWPCDIISTQIHKGAGSTAPHCDLPVGLTEIKYTVEEWTCFFSPWIFLPIVKKL